MPVTLFIQDNAGDHNFEQEYPDTATAQCLLATIEKSGGYWSEDRYGNVVYVPWHRVDFARITKGEENG